MTVSRSPKTALRAAAKLVRRQKRMPTTFSRKMDGMDCYCAEGAIYIACGLNSTGGSLDGKDEGDEYHRRVGVALRARKALIKRLDPRMGYVASSRIWDWNGDNRLNPGFIADVLEDVAR